VSFNPAFATHFFPLSAGLTWTYEVTYPNGARERIRDRVVKAGSPGTSRDAALVVSDYSGHGTRAVRADLPAAYPAETTEVETHYLLDGGYITRIASLGGPTRIRLEERGFLPQYLRPDQGWSNSLSPFADSMGDILKIAQSHRTFLEAEEVVVPAGRFSGCIRIETEALYQSPAEISDKRYYTDWYAFNVGLVKTLVLSGGQHGRETARIELLRFAKSELTAQLQPSNRRSIVPLSSKAATRSLTAGPLTGR